MFHLIIIFVCDSLTLRPRLLLNSLCCSSFPGIKRLILLQLSECWNYGHAHSVQIRVLCREDNSLRLNSLFGKICDITSIPWNFLYGNVVVSNWISLKFVLRVIFQSSLGMGLYTCFLQTECIDIYIYI